MSVASLVAIGIAVGLNNFAVALALGALGQESRRWRIASVFFVFEFTIPLVGLLIGAAVSELAADAGRWIGGALLVLIGVVAALADGLGPEKRERLLSRTTSWTGLIGLAAGLTVDNLAVGFALGMDGAEPLLLASVIAVAATAFTLLGLRMGHNASEADERRAQVTSGLLLVVLGLAVALGLIG